LTALRDVIREHNQEGFPASALEKTMKVRGKSLEFSDAEIERLADSSYREPNTFLLLSLLYPFIDLRNKFHVDHIFPSSLLTPSSLRKTDLSSEQIDHFTSCRDKLANLQLMEGAENNEKRAKLPKEWLELRYPEKNERTLYQERYDFGQESFDSVERFGGFYAARRKRLVARIKAILNAVD
jgi:hypothetical protein